MCSFSYVDIYTESLRDVIDDFHQHRILITLLPLAATIHKRSLAKLKEEETLKLAEKDKSDIKADLKKGLIYLHNNGFPHGRISADFTIVDEVRNDNFNFITRMKIDCRTLTQKIFDFGFMFLSKLIRQRAFRLRINYCLKIAFFLIKRKTSYHMKSFVLKGWKLGNFVFLQNIFDVSRSVA